MGFIIAIFFILFIFEGSQTEQALVFEGNIPIFSGKLINRFEDDLSEGNLMLRFVSNWGETPEIELIVFTQVGWFCEWLAEPLKIESHLRADAVEINPKHAHHLIFEQGFLAVSDYLLSFVYEDIHINIVGLNMVLQSLLLAWPKLDLQVAILAINFRILVSTAPFLSFWIGVATRIIRAMRG